ncbi:MAG: hypothetical protein C4539_14175 [Ignavibacteriales bacterium]|nr:MAG: hypothetical protein C4539_14175 [Ignavibacteriales bacterium]
MGDVRWEMSRKRDQPMAEKMGKEQLNISGLIIAAGLSSRMSLFKPLAKYNGNSFLTEIIRKLKLVCSNIVIVTGFKKDEINAEVEKYFPGDPQILLVFNPDYENGMFSSLQCGLRNLPESDWILYHFIDQPSLPVEFYKDFIEQTDNDYNWIQPRYKDRNGHPLLIGKSIFQTIINSYSNENLKIISSLPLINKKFWQCNYGQILQDIDTTEDYKREIQNEHL